MSLPLELRGNKKIQKSLREYCALSALLSAATTIATEHRMELTELLIKLTNLLNENNIITNKEV